MLIGLAGYAGSGKSEVARVLIEELLLTRVKFADPLKNMFRTMLADLGHTAEDIERYVEGDLKSSVIDGLHDIGVRSRAVQIALGTAFGREAVHPDLWAKVWRAKVYSLSSPLFLGNPHVVADDLRFLNEEAEIRSMRGTVLMVTRPGAEPAAFKWKRLGPWLYRRFGIMWGVHDSERIDRLSPDIIIENTGSLDDLRAKVRALCA